MEECLRIQYASFQSRWLWVQSMFLSFPEHLLAILYKVAVQVITMVDKIFLASKAFVAEFAHDRWRRECLDGGRYDAWWHDVYTFDAWWHDVHAEHFCQGRAVRRKQWQALYLTYWYLRPFGDNHPIPSESRLCGIGKE